ncbi:hypothetical protein B0H12DRAFT_1149013 [Mycena haematopus]|nr:hypothetical protein B0H12DRAFT_1149013 [Mycena haematopus]
MAAATAADGYGSDDPLHLRSYGTDSAISHEPSYAPPPSLDPFIDPAFGPNSTSIPIHSLLATTTPAAAIPSAPTSAYSKTKIPRSRASAYTIILVAQLETALCDLTASLNIEHLEQLRATCLATVWRHRTEWERNPAVHELQALVKEFVDQVGVEDSDADM